MAIVSTITTNFNEKIPFPKLMQSTKNPNRIALFLGCYSAIVVASDEPNDIGRAFHYTYLEGEWVDYNGTVTIKNKVD